jgi:hypothetical protein
MTSSEISLKTTADGKPQPRQLMSMPCAKAAAREGNFISYKDLADASGADWNQVHYAIGSHLWDLVEFAHLNGWPMLSAIVVNKPNVGSGKMEPETLKGFIAAAHDLGYVVTDEEAFLRKQQNKVFAWAIADAET